MSYAINGNKFSFASIEASIAGITLLLGFRSIDYSHRIEHAKVRGTSELAIGRVSGDYDAEGSVVLYKDDAERLIAALGEGYMKKTFDIVVHYREGGMALQTDWLRGCRIRSDGDSHSQGVDALETTFELDIFMLLKNGHNPLGINI